MLAQFEEYSAYENIFTGNIRAEHATKSLNLGIQDFVADCFKMVKFAKDFQEAKDGIE